MKGASLSNGYLRYHSGPLRGKYVARVRLEKKLGRKLWRNEQADHRNGKRTDNRRGNLQPLNIRKHGRVTRQRAKKCRKVGGYWKCPF